MLVQTKFIVPPVRRSLVARPRLTNKLDRALGDSHRLVVVSAPAGFGKTTMLSEWVARLPLKVAWLDLEEDDNYPLRFFEYFCGSIKKACPAIDSNICQDLKDPDEIATRLVNTLAQIGERIVLVLDDYHFIRIKTIHTAVASILDHLPVGVTVIISTRV
ncbi:MAG: AAA family ATPase, partial [Anaerolineales bacterium]